MDKELLLHKLSYQKDLLDKIDSRLKKYCKETDKEEKDTLFAALSKFTEEVVETAIKINTIILEDNKDYADTYFESFSKLSRYLTIDEMLLEKLAKTSGFRNRISHEYDQLDVSITIKSFEQILILYPKYIEIIKSNFL